MSSKNTKQANLGTNIGQGLLAGTALMSALEAIKFLRRINKDKQSEQTLKEIVLEKKKEEDAGFQKDSSTTWDATKRSLGRGADFVGNMFGELTEKGMDVAGENFAENAAILGALGIGAYGTSEVFDELQKRQTKKDTERLREYYYARLLESSGKGEMDAASEYAPLERKKMANVEQMTKQAEGDKPGAKTLSMLTALAAFGIPLSTAYIVKQYMDETMPGTKQPSADSTKDPRSQIGRTRVKPDEEEKEEDNEYDLKMFDGIGKAASLAPASEKAFNTAHLYRTLLGNTKQANSTVLPDIIRTIEVEGASRLINLAAERDLDGFVEHAIKTASENPDAPSTDASRHLATDLVGADYRLRSMAMPLLSAEFFEQFPTSVKSASTLRPEFANYCLAFAKAETLDAEERLFGEGSIKQASERDAVELTEYAERLNSILTPASLQKEASADTQEVRDRLFAIKK